MAVTPIRSKERVSDFPGLREIVSTIEQGLAEGKLPLFVVGSGVSATAVPLLGEMTQWFLNNIPAANLDKDLARQLIAQGSLICQDKATRADAAGFFAALQLVGSHKGLEELWQNFSKALTVTGFPKREGTYTGLFALRPHHCSDAHRILARLLKMRLCHVLNLNYDPLLLLAGQETNDGNNIIPLYSTGDIIAYYTANARGLDGIQPAITNARGDVFFAKCQNPLCPQQNVDRVIEPYKFTEPGDAFTCPVCRQQDSSRLQLSFPGYEAKEKLVRDTVRCLRRFIAQRASIVISLGLSGQWDPFLIQELLDLAASYELPVVYVRRSALDPSKVNFFEQLIQRSYPEIMVQYSGNCACLMKVGQTADNFCKSLASSIEAFADSIGPPL